MSDRKPWDKLRKPPGDIMEWPITSGTWVTLGGTKIGIKISSHSYCAAFTIGNRPSVNMGCRSLREFGEFLTEVADQIQKNSREI